MTAEPDRISADRLTEETKMYPVLFTYEEIVKGHGFAAGVLARGHALMVHEDGEWWMHGVQPGVLSEGGDTFEESRQLFRQAFREILFDLVAEAKDFDAFKSKVESILIETNEPMRVLWNEAREKLRRDQLDLEGPVQQLPRVEADKHVVSFSVECLSPLSLSPDNKVDEYCLAKAS